MKVNRGVFVKRVTVVGAGISGLTSAAYLSRNNEVTLLEKSDVIGGLIGSFSRNNIIFDKGIRALENSGTVFPMLRDLGIEIDWVKSDVTIGLGKETVNIQGEDYLDKYASFLYKSFPKEKREIEMIIDKIVMTSRYMQVLYGVDNPLFLDYRRDYKYLMKTIIPWMIKYSITVKKIEKLNEPINEYLRKITKNNQLIDAISQHFFPKTPTFFGLSYFSMLNDYYYPRGGMQSLVDSLKNYILKNGGKIITNSEVTAIDPRAKLAFTSSGRYSYDSLIWAGDLKHLYHSIPLQYSLTATKTKQKIENHAVDKSIFIIYLSTNLPSKYYAGKTCGHGFFTPSKEGISSLSISEEEIVNKIKNTSKEERRETLFNWLKEFMRKQTYEIGIPVLNDSTLAPKGKSGMSVSFLFDYKLTAYIKEIGLYQESKRFIENQVIELLDSSFFHGIKDSVFDIASTSPLALQERLNNSGGSTTGWSNDDNLPVECRLRKIARSVKTPFKNILQAGQWSFSLSGVPTSIIVGKIAADKIK